MPSVICLGPETLCWPETPVLIFCISPPDCRKASIWLAIDADVSEDDFNISLVSIEKSITKKCDVIFSGLPHAASAEQIKAYFNDDLKILDLSADFRLNNLDSH